MTHIIHVADIHVRIGSRIEEYRHIFNAFCDEIESLPAVVNGTAILVIAGDVFHTKGRVDSSAGKCLFEWINRLILKVPVFIICGNHDFQQGHNESTDMIELIVTPYAMKNLFYLNATGHYAYGNVGFGITRVQDTLRACNTSGIVTDLPPFPPPNALNTQHKVALFHGTISQSALPSGRRAESVAKGYPLEWFQGYDLVLLGDNHKQQIHVTDAGMKWGYPGSLIQQDHGEPLLGHGYIVWDLDACTAVAHHIPNPNGALTVTKTPTGFDAVLDTCTHVPLMAAIASTGPLFPSTPRLRVIGTYADGADVSSVLAAAGVTPCEVRITNPKAVLAALTSPASPHQPIASVSLAHLNQPSEWCAYISEKDPSLSTEWIVSPHALLIPTLDAIATSISSRNTKILSLLEAYDAELQRSSTSNHSVVLQYIQFQYILCYGKNNWFDFDLVDGHIALLNGENAVGKSAFMDVVCTALFGEPTSSRRDFSGDSMAVKIIHDGKPHGESAFITLRIHVDGKPFEIHRTFTYAGTDERRVDGVLAKATVYAILGDTKETVAEGTTSVDRWVHANIGTSEETLMSAMLSQQDHSNFFFQNAATQRAIIERALHMDTITAFESVLDESVRGHKYILDQIIQYHKGIADAVTEEPVTMHQTDTTDACEQLRLLTDEMHALLTRVGGGYEEWTKSEDPELCLSRATEERISLGNDEVDERELLVCKGELEHRRRAIPPHTRRFTSLEDAKAWLNTHEKPHPVHEEPAVLPSNDIEAALAADDLFNGLGWDDSAETTTQSTKDLITRYVTLRTSLTKVDDQTKQFGAIFALLTTTPVPQCGRRSRAKPMTFAAMSTAVDAFKRAGGLVRPDNDAIAKRNWLSRLAAWEALLPLQSSPLEDLQKEHDELLLVAELTRRLEDLDGTLNHACDACVSRRERTLHELGDRRPNPVRVAELKHAIEHELRRPEMEHEKGMWAAAHKQTLMLVRLRNERVRLAEFVNQLQSQRASLEEELADATGNMRRRWAGVRKCIAWRAFVEWNEATWTAERFVVESELRAMEEGPLRRIELDATIAMCQRTLARRRLETVRSQRKAAEEEVCRARDARIRTDAALDASRLRVAKQESVSRAMADMQSRVNGLKRMQQHFSGDKQHDGFKLFVYRNKVIPLIQDEVNDFLQALDAIRLKIRIKNNKFIFMLEDRGATPTLDHASGYQKFIVNLGMRVALSRIGAVGQNLKHLFMDEGFVACDAENLRKTSGMLREIMTFGGYRSLILMSHLETIRDAAEVHVTIARSADNKFSLLRWGEQRTGVAKVAATGHCSRPCGGRPRKKA